MTRRPPFQFVGEKHDQGTVEALNELQQQAAAGKLIGVSYTALYRERNWAFGATGEAERNPAFVLGLMVVQVVAIALRIVGGTR